VGQLEKVTQKKKVQASDLKGGIQSEKRKLLKIKSKKRCKDNIEIIIGEKEK